MSGANAEFNIIGIRYGRLMEIDLTGNPANKRIVIEPAAYTGNQVTIDPGAGHTDGMGFKLRMVQ